MKSLGERIREYRTSIKMTQTDFAIRLGITGASVSAYENGTRLPSYEVLIKIANVLGVSTDELLGRKEPTKVTVDITNLSPRERNVIQELITVFTEEKIAYKKQKMDLDQLSSHLYRKQKENKDKK